MNTVKKRTMKLVYLNYPLNNNNDDEEEEEEGINVVELTDLNRVDVEVISLKITKTTTTKTKTMMMRTNKKRKILTGKEKKEIRVSLRSKVQQVLRIDFRTLSFLLEEDRVTILTVEREFILLGND
jgi:hypothetical protein